MEIVNFLLCVTRCWKGAKWTLPVVSDGLPDSRIVGRVDAKVVGNVDERQACVDEVLSPLVVANLFDCLVWVKGLKLLEDRFEIAFLSVCIHRPCFALQLYYQKSSRFEEIELISSSRSCFRRAFAS